MEKECQGRGWKRADCVVVLFAWFRENRSCDSTVGVIVAELNDNERVCPTSLQRKSNLAIHYDLGTQSPSSLFSANGRCSLIPRYCMVLLP